MQVANPLHMHYLHWRLQHCDVPVQDLLQPAAVQHAAKHIPSVHDIFAVEHKLFAHGGHAKGQPPVER